MQQSLRSRPGITRLQPKLGKGIRTGTEFRRKHERNQTIINQQRKIRITRALISVAVMPSPQSEPKPRPARLLLPLATLRPNSLNQIPNSQRRVKPLLYPRKQRFGFINKPHAALQNSQIKQSASVLRLAGNHSLNSPPRLFNRAFAQQLEGVSIVAVISLRRARQTGKAATKQQKEEKK